MSGLFILIVPALQLKGAQLRVSLEGFARMILVLLTVRCSGPVVGALSGMSWKVWILALFSLFVHYDAVYVDKGFMLYFLGGPRSAEG